MQMKKTIKMISALALVLLFGAGIFTGLVACGNSGIVGQWQIESYTMQYANGTVTIGPGHVDWISEFDGAGLEFTSDGKLFELKNGVRTSEEPVTFKLNRLQLTIDASGVQSTITIAWSSGKLVLPMDLSTDTTITYRRI
jgi:hypothetical protein